MKTKPQLLSQIAQLLSHFGNINLKVESIERKWKEFTRWQSTIYGSRWEIGHIFQRTPW